MNSFAQKVSLTSLSMTDRTEFERWMSQAKKTFELIDADIQYGGYAWACFKAQQAAEFAVKALLYLLGVPAFGHEISKLLRKIENVPKEVMKCAKLLDKLYIPPRYPDAFPEGAPWEFFDEEDALQAKACAKKVIEWVESYARDLGEEEKGEGEGHRGVEESHGEG